MSSLVSTSAPRAKQPQPVPSDISGLIAPVRPARGSCEASKGPLDRKPWDYRVTAVIPVLDTPEQLAVCVAVLRAQSERPYIVVIDTGSLTAEFAQIEAMRAEDLEVHAIRSHGWRNPSEPVAVACQLGQDLARTAFCFQTHADCFLKRRTVLQEWADLAAVHGAVSYRISPRPYPGWETEIGHTAAMFHLPTIRKANVNWNMAAFCERFGPVPTNLHISTNRPDTESQMNAGLADAGISPLILGTEENYARNNNEDFDHPRSFCCSKIYSPDYHSRISPDMQAAMREACQRVEEWTKQ